jgi:hypothetical protein
MPQSDGLHAGNFLPDKYSERLQVVESAAQLLEPDPNSGASVNAQLGECIIRLAGSTGRHARFITTEAKRLPGNSNATAEGRAVLFQLHGFLAAYLDVNLRISTDMAALVTGDMEANDPDNAPAGYEAGEETILKRAQHTASSLLRATDVIYRGYDDAPDSAWDKTLAAQRSRTRKAKAGPKIKNAENQQFTELRIAALETPIHEVSMQDLPFKPSRFGVITFLRAAKAAKAELPSGQETSGVVLLEKTKYMASLASAGQPTPLELTPVEIAQVMGTATKVLKHIRNAARADASIATDPTVRYLSFMMSGLGGGYAINSEMTAFQRKARQTAAQLRQFHEA